MRDWFLILVLCGVFAMSLVAGCGSDSTTPEDTGPPAFSRMIGGAGNATSTGGVVVTSDGLRVVTGTCGSVLSVTGSSKTLDGTGTSRVYFLAFKPDGGRAWSTIVAGGGAFPTIIAMARDSNNNLLIIGYSAADMTFGTTDLNNAGNTDILMAKVDATGNAVWAQMNGGTAGDAGLGIAAAADGSVYACGIVEGEVAVAGKTVGVLGKYSGFLVKMTTNGVGVWQQTAAPASESRCDGVAVSQDGSVLVCGRYESTVEIGGVILPNDGGNDGFIARFGADGAPIGNIRIGGTGVIGTMRITTISDEPVVAGLFTGTADFDVNTAGGAVAAVGMDAFVARYSKAGALLWVRTLGGTGDQQITGLARTGSGNLLTCGTFTTAITLGSKTLTASGQMDGFFARLSGSGQVLSGNTLGGSNEDMAVGIASSGDVAIVAGTTASDPATFPDGNQRTLFGDSDSFIYQQP